MSLGLSSVNIVKNIDKSAIEAIKNQIFDNAQQKAALVAKNDVMNDARAEFRQRSNPFNFDVASANKDKSSSTGTFAGQQNHNKDEDVKKVTLKNKISLDNEMQTQAMQESVMLQARNQISGSSDLMSKLKFLQTQTAISSYASLA